MLLQGQSLPEQAASGDNEIAFNAVEDVDNDAARLCAALDPPDNRVETSAVISFQIIYMVCGTFHYRLLLLIFN